MPPVRIDAFAEFTTACYRDGKASTSSSSEGRRDLDVSGIPISQQQREMHTAGCGQICAQVLEANDLVVFVFQRGTVETLAGNPQLGQVVKARHSFTYNVQPNEFLIR